MGSLVESKNRSPILFQILVVVMWFGGEIFGGILGLVLARMNNEDIRFNLKSYLFAIIGAALGAGLIFAIAACLPEVREDDDFDEERFQKWQKKRGGRGKSRARPSEDDEDEDERRHYSV
jgi:hypothetical protein